MSIHSIAGTKRIFTGRIIIYPCSTVFRCGDAAQQLAGRGGVGGVVGGDGVVDASHSHWMLCGRSSARQNESNQDLQARAMRKCIGIAP